ncbi:hypothetical protein ACJMK2_005878, partial [Sinanodonta woodiana]
MGTEATEFTADSMVEGEDMEEDMGLVMGVSLEEDEDLEYMEDIEAEDSFMANRQ